MRVPFGFLFFLPLLIAVGCGDSSGGFVPVSGKVMLNNKPLADAWIEFQPIATKKGGDTAGPGSVGKTDQEGRYTLRSSLNPDQTGALPGNHMVRISTSNGNDTGDLDADNPRAKRDPKRVIVPNRYNENTELKTEVPSKGTDSANFDLKSP